VRRFHVSPFCGSRYADNLADDVPLLHGLMEQGLLFLTPAGADDDLFFIKYARENACWIVTNDNLRDHHLPREFDELLVKFMFVHDVFLTL
jgi:hypothetical protein